MRNRLCPYYIRMCAMWHFLKINKDLKWGNFDPDVKLKINEKIIPVNQVSEANMDEGRKC